MFTILPKKDNDVQALLFVVAFILYLSFLARSLNFFDAVTYANALKISFQTGDTWLPFTAFGAYGPGSSQGFGRSAAYVLLSYPYSYVLTNFFKTDFDFALNSFSAIVVAGSAVFVYRSAKLFFDNKFSFLLSLLYVITPFIFFLGINASNYSPLLLFSSIWIYYILLYFKTKIENYVTFSSIVLVANIFAHPIAIPLLLPHAYVFLTLLRAKSKMKIRQLTQNSIIFLPVAALLYYFTFVNPAYPVEPNLTISAFVTTLFGYQLVNGLSLVFFVAVVFNLALLVKKFVFRKVDKFDIFFLLTLISLASSLFYFNDIPIVRFAPLFPLFYLLIFREMKNFKKFHFIIYLAIIFMLIKFLPIAYQFHNFPHPHKAYALWLDELNPRPDVIVVGHECPFIEFYTSLNRICKSSQDLNVTLPTTGVYVTEEYFKNENEMEFEFMQKTFDLPFNAAVASRIYEKDLLQNKTFTKSAEYDMPVRNFEDMFQWLFTIYPNPILNIIVNTDFIKPKYAVYEVLG